MELPTPFFTTSAPSAARVRIPGGCSKQAMACSTAPRFTAAPMAPALSFDSTRMALATASYTASPGALSTPIQTPPSGKETTEHFMGQLDVAAALKMPDRFL